MNPDRSCASRGLSWSARSDGAVLTVSFIGDLDMAVVGECAAGLEEPLAGAERVIVIDLSRLAFADSTALRFLIDTKRLMEMKGKRLLLGGTSPAVTRLLEASKLTTWFDRADGLEFAAER